MNEPTSAAGADDVLDFSDIVLITMSSATTNGRVMAASICSCGYVVAPDVRRPPMLGNGYDAAAPRTRRTSRMRRWLVRVVESLRAS